MRLQPLLMFTANLCNRGLLPDPFEMALGEKLFEESGTITGFNIIKVHPQEGLTMEVSFISEIRGIGRFPSGKNLGSGITTQYSHGVVDASWQGSITTTEGEQFVWGGAGKIQDS